jgi:hypothetical protein
MNESWKKHIQPILDSWQHWDHFSWVWDPFIEKYPKLSPEVQAQVDDALSACAFDVSHEEEAIQALGIAEALFFNHLASQNLIESIRSGLRDQLSSLDINAVITFYYVTGYSTFGIKEAIPAIQQLVVQLEDKNVSGSLDERPAPHSHTFRELLEACSAATQELSP